MAGVPVLSSPLLRRRPLELSANENELKGTVLDSVGSSIGPKARTINSAGLIGAVPAAIQRLSSLATLYLECNRFSGALPESIWFAAISLIGTLPNAMQAMLLLLDLVLSDNKMHGSFPCYVTPVYGLDMAHNRLTGTIPGCVKHFSYLRCLFLSGNRLTGRIPEPVMQSKVVMCFAMGQNRLTGTIPESFTLCKNMQILVLDENALEGTIPGQLAHLEHLHHVDISAGPARIGSAGLRGAIPALGFQGPNRLFLLHGQTMEGRMPYLAASFKVLTLHEAQLQGLPAILHCDNGSHVILHRNRLSCDIPALQLSGQGQIRMSFVAIGNHLFRPRGAFPHWIMPYEHSHLLWVSRSEGTVLMARTLMGSLLVILPFRLHLSLAQALEAILHFASGGEQAAFFQAFCHASARTWSQLILSCATTSAMLGADFYDCPSSLFRLSTLLTWDRWALAAIGISWWRWCNLVCSKWWLASSTELRWIGRASFVSMRNSKSFTWLCWWLVVFPFALPAVVQLAAMCVPDLLVSDDFWSRFLNLFVSSAQGLVCGVIMPRLARLISRGSIHIKPWTLLGTGNLFIVCVLPCCVVFFMDGACLAHWTLWWRPCQHHAHLFRASTTGKDFMIVNNRGVSYLHIAGLAILNAEDICSPARGMSLSMCVRSLLGKVHALILGKLTSSAFFLPTWHLSRGFLHEMLRKRSRLSPKAGPPKLSTEIILQLAMFLSLGLIFASTLPLSICLLLPAIVNSCMVAVVASTRNFRVEDDAGVAAVTIRMALGLSVLLHVSFLLK